MAIVFSTASVSDLTEAQKEALLRLERIHGDITVSKESSGLHANMASPEALRRDGMVELKKKHLSLNLTKLFRNGFNTGFIARCMKYETPYRFPDLLRYAPVSERGYPEFTASGFVSKANTKRLFEISPGVFVPHYPGKTVPLTSLTDNHPVIEYVVSRGYSPRLLEEQFGCAFCTMENPHLNYYKAAFPRTSQGRLIFYIMSPSGQYQGWQARVLQKRVENLECYYHPRNGQYVPVWTYMSDGKKLANPNYPRATELPKYLLAPGTKKNQVLMGAYAAALRMNTLEESSRYIILTEGPLDAARLGIGACACMGKTVSDDQFKLAYSIARRIIYVSQNDSSGESARARVEASSVRLSIPVTVVKPPRGYNDVGDMSPDKARNWFKILTGILIYNDV